MMKAGFSTITTRYSPSGFLVEEEKRRATNAAEAQYALAKNYATNKKLAELGWQTVPHPRYSSDLAPSDYHLFRPLKHFLRGKTFVNYDDLKTGVTDFFTSQLPEF